MKEEEKVAYTPREFAAKFGKSETWGYRQLYAGKVEAITGYGRIMIPKSEVDRLLATAGRYLGVDADKSTTTGRAKPKRKSGKNPERFSWIKERRESGLSSRRKTRAAIRKIVKKSK